MLEAERPLARQAPAVGLDQLLAHEPARGAGPARRGRARPSARRRPRRRTTARRWRQPRRPRARPGRAGRGAPPAARGSSAARRRWGSADGRDARLVALDVALVDEHAHELLDEQRVALGAREDAVGQLRPPRRASPTRCSTSARLSSAVSGSSSTRSALGAAPAKLGRVSNRSLRETATISTGRPEIDAARCSIRSSRVGSAQCTSSKRTTSGWRAATASSSWRTAQNVSGGVRRRVGQPERPRHALDDGRRVVVGRQQARDPGLGLLGAGVRPRSRSARRRSRAAART